MIDVSGIYELILICSYKLLLGLAERTGLVTEEDGERVRCRVLVVKRQKMGGSGTAAVHAAIASEGER